MRLNKLILFLIVAAVLTSCNGSSNASNESEVAVSAIQPPTSLKYDIVKVYKHDTSSYTQGLEWAKDYLIEGTGERNSILHLLDTQMNEVGKKVKLDPSLFGEGTTLFKGKIYQLTWKNNKVLVYDAKTLVKMNELNWPYEGWGLTHNDTSLIVSTGGSNIYFVDPTNFSIIRTLGVFNNYGYVSDINELEYVDGKIYANLYLSDNIIEIDAATGQIVGNADMTELLAQSGVKYNPKLIDGGYVLNGIAYQQKSKTFFVTGKCWPVMVELKFK